jgi:TRAP-type C4-dicarboxylate transport system substrate-binding protein
MSLFSFRLPIAALVLAASASAMAEPPTMRSAGVASANRAHSDGVERPFFEGLATAIGAKTKVSYNPYDVLGLNQGDALRSLRSGTFDVMTVQIGLAARDDPMFDGVDLVGVSTSMADLRKITEAYRATLDQRLQQRFNAKIMTLWPYGPQVVYCATPLKSLDDLKGQKIRVHSQSLGAFAQFFGAVPVTLQFPEVYPALQRGVVNCAVTSPTSGNTGKWPEVTSVIVPLSLGGGMQGHFMNLDHWKRYTPEQQARLTAEFRKLEDRLWAVANESNDDALSCNLGKEPCNKPHTKFSMRALELSAADQEKFRAAVSNAILPLYRKTCVAVESKCPEIWNATVGKASGYTMQ